MTPPSHTLEREAVEPWNAGSDQMEAAAPAVAPPAQRPARRSPELPVLTSDDPVVCECLQVRMSTLRVCVARGCGSLDDLARETGATTACGSCLPRVADLVGGDSGTPARIVGVRKLLPDVWSFRLEPLDLANNPMLPSLPGQHIVVSGLVGSTWVSRPYTLTSPGGGRPFREITVKLNPQGTLSPWLFGQGRDFTALRITQPRGDYHVDVHSAETAVLLVGGIGVTPAISAARTLIAERSPKRLHIDYSAHTAEGLAFRDELRRLAESYENITVRFRITQAEGLLQLEDVRRYDRVFPSARYYICGPETYQEAAREYLDTASVPTDRVHVESFYPARAAPAEPQDVLLPRRRSDLAVVAVGLALLAAYVAQGVLDWRWPGLEALQDDESYRRWSGSVLLSFIAAQWILPGLRLRGQLRAAAAAYPWHRAMGALAPLFFYAHATHLGYGYLLALSFVYLTNVAVGLADKTLVRDPARRDRYARIWLVPHVALACLTVGLALFHLFVVFAYR